MPDLLSRSRSITSFRFRLFSYRPFVSSSLSLSSLSLHKNLLFRFIFIVSALIRVGCWVRNWFLNEIRRHSPFSSPLGFTQIRFRAGHFLLFFLLLLLLPPVPASCNGRPVCCCTQKTIDGEWPKCRWRALFGSWNILERKMKKSLPVRLGRRLDTRPLRAAIIRQNSFLSVSLYK